MFSYIIGEITQKGENVIVLESNKIGYEINVSSFAMQNYEGLVGDIKVYTYFKTSDDGVALYGFFDQEEKNMFLQLISVSGVGPKGAMTILSNIPVTDLANVIASGDAKLLSSVKGVGKKTAERIIVDLKDKVDATGEIVETTIIENSNPEILDATSVLVNLGLNKAEGTRLAKSVYEDGDSAEDIVRKALSQIRG